MALTLTKMMTLKTYTTQHPQGLTRLQRIRLHPFLHFGLTVAVILTTGAADTLSHCPFAHAEAAPETDDRPTPPTAVTVPFVSTSKSNSADSQAFAYSAHTQVIAALNGEMVLPVQPNGTPTGNRDFVLYVDASKTQLQRLTPPRPGRSLLLADSGVPAPSDKVLRQGSSVLGMPSVQLQGVFRQEGSDTSARARVRAFYPVTPNAGFGAEVDLTTGIGFADSQETGLNLNELYFAGSLPSLPTLRFVVGLMDLTSYFDRNSFAKDGATHFFNSVFQTNPALSAAGIGSRPGLLVNWSATDDIDLKATAFSSTRNLGDFNLDAFAGEVGVRFGTAIIRGTYVSSRDAGQRSGFREIFDIPRSGNLGSRSGDREEAYGINAEVFIPSLKLGLFGRYGRYTNLNLDASGTTYSAGLSFLDIFLPSDRLGLGYGRQLSNDDLRQARGDNNPDVLELFYDFRITPNLRAAVMLQERNGFSETVLGVRVRTDFDLSPLFRRSR